MALEEYRRKRTFDVTPEPAAKVERSASGPVFVIQEHHATRLHWDLRLEVDGVLKSWAVTKEPTMDPTIKRLAVQTEDHPLKYATFHGDIPEGQYGAGHMEIWDTGRFDAIGDIRTGLRKGKIEFELHGRKLSGSFVMVRTNWDRSKDNWLLMKMKEKEKGGAAARGRETAGGWVRPGGGGGAAQRRPGGGGGAVGRTSSSKATGRAPEKVPAKVAYTHTDKLMFPEAAATSAKKMGVTKGDILAYYEQIAPVLLPHLKDRPVTLERLPNGLNGTGKEAPQFWQKNTPKHYPSWIPRARLPAEDRKGAASLVDYLLINNEQTLLYLVNQNALTFHVFFSRVESLETPDFVLFDIDPHQSTFANAVKAARSLHEILEGQGTESFVKTSGKSGLHVLVPWKRPREKSSYDDARAWALTVAQDVVRDMPDVATTERQIKARGERVYVDVVQNAMGRHAVPPYVLRATPRATVSAPLKWAEVKAGLDPRDFTMAEVIKRVKRLGDLMKPLLS